MRCWTCGGIEIMGSMEAHRSPNHKIDDVETCYAAFNGFQSGIYYYKGVSQSPASEPAQAGNEPATGQPFRGFAPRKKNL